VNETKRLIAIKQSTDPRILCVVSKKMKRNEQHNPLSPPRRKGKRKRKRKRKERNKEVRGSGQPLFCCSCGVLLFTQTKNSYYCKII
jgi:hypothetical protein